MLTGFRLLANSKGVDPNVAVFELCHLGSMWTGCDHARNTHQPVD